MKHFESYDLQYAV